MLIVVFTLDIDTAKKKTFRTASSEGCTFSSFQLRLDTLRSHIVIIFASVSIINTALSTQEQRQDYSLSH